MEEKGILAIDIGTSSIRTTIYIKNKGIKNKFTLSQKGEARFSANLLWEKVSDLIKQTIECHPNIIYEAIGVSAFLGWVVVNKSGIPVEKAWGWQSNGNEDEVRLFKKCLPKNTSITIGRNINSELGVFQWGGIIREAKEPLILLSIKDYINYKLTGNFKMDRTHASYTGLFSIKKRKWDSKLMDVYKIPLISLPKLSDGFDAVGTVLFKIAKEFGLKQNTKVVLGGPDGTLAVLGGGGTKSGKTIEVMGTTDVLFQVTDDIDTKETVNEGLIKNCHIIPDLFAVGGPTGMTGGTITWLMKTLNWTFNSKQFENLLVSWDARKPASNGLFVSPYLTGSRTPDWSPNTRGMIVGLSLEHTSEDILKATLEGIAFGTKRILDKLESLLGEIDTLIAIGGGASNDNFLRTRANVIGKKIAVPIEIEASTCGAIALASTLVNWYDDIHSAIASINPTDYQIRYSEKETQEYEDSYTKFNKVFFDINERL